MPWKETCAMSERKDFIDLYLSREDSFSSLCAEFGISRKTGYKWLGRFKAKGIESLSDRSRAPLNHPNALSQEVQDAVLKLRRKYDWGPEKLLVKFQEAYPDLEIPARSSVARLLKTNGLVAPRRRRSSASPTPSPLTDGSAEQSVWSIDYKGQFPLLANQMCYPLTCCDHESRMLICCQGFTEINWLGVKARLKTLFQEQGIPDVIRSDNGPPFASTSIGGLTQLNVWWIKLGIRPERIKPGRPDQNGRHERMHRELKAKTTKGSKRTLASQQRLFDRFRREYNEERPHQALNNEYPAQHYRPPSRPYLSPLEEMQYPEATQTRMVCRAGYMRWHSAKVFVSSTLVGERLGVTQVEDGLHEVYFGPLFLGILDEQMQGPLRLKQYESRIK